MLDRLEHIIRSVFFMYNWDYGVLAAVLLIASLLFIALRNKVSNKRVRNAIFLVFFFSYFALMIYTALIDRSSSAEPADYCLIPFRSYYLFFKGNKDIMQQSIMNVAFFYPFGFLLSCVDTPLINKRSRVIVLSAFLLSAFIEICQYIFRLGYAEIDDIIHNTLGAVLGILAFQLLNRIKPRTGNPGRFEVIGNSEDVRGRGENLK